MGTLAANAFSSAEHICLCLLHSASPSRQLPADWSGVKPGGEAKAFLPRSLRKARTPSTTAAATALLPALCRRLMDFRGGHGVRLCIIC